MSIEEEMLNQIPRQMHEDFLEYRTCDECGCKINDYNSRMCGIYRICNDCYSTFEEAELTRMKEDEWAVDVMT